MTQSVEEIIGDSFSLDAFEPRYRAVGTGKARKGLRLENTYWNTLKLIADERNIALASLIEEVSQFETGHRNLASALRVLCQEWSRRKIEELEGVTDDQMIRSIIYASASPALALTSDKRLHSFNESFLRYVTSKFPALAGGFPMKGLRLTLDTQMDILLAQLEQNNNQPIQVGIAIGVNDKRVRTTIKVVRAPYLNYQILLAYVVP